MIHVILLAKKNFGIDGFQNMFVYQPKLDTLELKKKIKALIMFLVGNQKEVFTSTLRPSYTAFLHSTKFFGYKLEIKFDKDPLDVEQNNYLTKIVNAYTVYEINSWPRNPTNNFKLRNCLLDATNIARNGDKGKWVNSGSGITFDGADSWNFSNDFARNVMIFGVDNGSSSHTDNRKTIFLILGKGQTYGINGSFGSPEKTFNIDFSKARTTFCLSLHYNHNNSYLFINGKVNFKLKANNENVNFLAQFCLGSISNGFGAIVSREVFLKGHFLAY